MLKKLTKILFLPLIFILGISIVYALGESCCGDYLGGSATLCSGTELCILNGTNFFRPNSTNCATLGELGKCEAQAPNCSYCDQGGGCDYKYRPDVSDGTYNFTLYLSIYQSEDEYGSAVLGSPATSSSDRAVCIMVMGDPAGSNVKSFIISNLSSTTSITLGSISVPNLIDPISSAKTSDSIYWNFCPDGHTGACSSGSGMTGANETSWMYYTIPDSIPIKWANFVVVDPVGSEPIPTPGGEADSSDSLTSGGTGGDIPEFSTTGIIAAIIVILAAALVVYKKKK